MEIFYSASSSEAPVNGYPRIPEFGYGGFHLGVIFETDVSVCISHILTNHESIQCLIVHYT
jgi:hypothetical protein